MALSQKFILLCIKWCLDIQYIADFQKSVEDFLTNQKALQVL